MKSLKLSFFTFALLLFCIPTVLATDTVLEINRVHCEANSGKVRKDSTCMLGDYVIIETSNLSAWIDKDSNRTPESLILMLNGELLKGMTGTRSGEIFEKSKSANAPAIKKGDQIRFQLRGSSIDEERNETWKRLLARSKFFESRRMKLRLGFEDGSVSYKAGEIYLEIASKGYQLLIITVFVGLLASFLSLVKKSDIIRIPGEKPVDIYARKMYSMGRSQMAWWFFIIAGSFLYIWLITGDVNTITDKILILVGISTATGFSAAVLDKSKKNEVETTLTRLAGEKSALEAKIEELKSKANVQPAPPELESLNKQIIDFSTQLHETEMASSKQSDISPKQSRSFFQDILQDESGVTFHRFQMLAWTIILGFVFIRSVFTNLSMPEFDTTLLGILGISSGTYIGFKFPEPPKE